MRSYKLLLFFFLFAFTFSFGQNSKKAKLEANQKKLNKEISLINASLKQMNKEKESSIGKLNTLNRLVTIKGQLLRNIQQEIGHLSKETSELEEIITSMSNDIDSLRKEYAEMVYQASKVHQSSSKLTLLLTSNSYQEVKSKLKLLSMFAEARQQQVEKINLMKTILEAKNTQLQERVKEKEGAKRKLEKEKSDVINLKSEQSSLVKELEGKEDDIKKKLKQKEKEKQKIERLIKRIIEAQIKANTVKTPKEQGSHGKDAIKSKEFEKNKGLLPWPIVKCFVSGRFGKHPHPTIKGIYEDNNGIKLQTPVAGAPVRCIFNGKVSTVATIPGVGKVVMIKHGKYYTVYSGVSNVTVKAGQIVTTKQTIGKTKKGIDGNYVLDFQIWNGMTKINPVPWLYR